MKSVGETMAIGRTFKESLQKALRGLEIGHFGLGGGKKDRWGTPKQPSACTRSAASCPFPMRNGFFSSATHSRPACRSTTSTSLTDIDPWFLRNIRDLIAVEDEIRQVAPPRRRERRLDPQGEAERLFRPPARLVVERHRNGGPPAAQRNWGSRRPSSRSTRARPSSRPTLRTTIRPTKQEDETPAKTPGRQADHDPGRRPEPDRPGDRVRLLLLPCLVCAGRVGHRKHHGQLESRRRFRPITTRRTSSSSSR